MTNHRPHIVARSPGPDHHAPAGTREFAITFDRPMDRSRGRCRLSWSRLRLHTKNIRMPRYDWSVRQPELAWSPDGQTLTLTLPRPLCDGHRVRVEWTELTAADGGGPPLPDTREDGASYVVSVGAIPRGVPEPPRFGSLPLDGATDVRRDTTLELYSDQPLAAFSVDDLEVMADGHPVPFHLHTNRNPPDWIYIHLEALLPPDTEVVVRGPGLRSTLGVPAGDGPLMRVRTGRRAPVLATPHPTWSEPIEGLTDHPTDRIEAALRFWHQPILAHRDHLRRHIHVVHDQTGERVPGITADLDPTPAHYRTIFVRSTRRFPGLSPDTTYRLEWEDLGWPGITPGPPGAVRFRTAPAGATPVPLAPCPHICLIADEEATRLQVAVQAFGEVRSVTATEPARPGWSAALTPHHSPNFRDMVDGDTRVAPPSLWTTLGNAPALLPVDGPTTRHFELAIEDGAGRVRRVPVLAFDMGPQAITDVVLTPGPRPSARWRLRTPTDSHHLSNHDEHGGILYGGVLDGSVRAWRLPSGWDLPPGRYLFQLWLLKATPEDDLWDHAVVDRWFEV